MTAAQVYTAAFLISPTVPEEIVHFSEIGSEGAVLRFGADRRFSNSWLIARNGDALHSDGRAASFKDDVAPWLEGE